MAKPTKMVQEENATEMVSEEQPAVAAKKEGHKRVHAKLNMKLPSGTILTQGEEVDLSPEDQDFLAKKHPAENHKHIYKKPVPKEYQQEE